MVLKNFGLKSVNVMYNFITFYSAFIAHQAMNFKCTIEEVKEMHGSIYPYICVLTLTGAE